MHFSEFDETVECINKEMEALQLENRELKEKTKAMTKKALLTVLLLLVFI